MKRTVNPTVVNKHTLVCNNYKCIILCLQFMWEKNYTVQYTIHCTERLDFIKMTEN